MTKNDKVEKKNKNEILLENKYTKYNQEINSFFLLPEKNQLGWIIGMLETDGSLGLTYRQDKGAKSNNPRNHRLDPYFDITQQDEVVCVIIAYFFFKIHNFGLPTMTKQQPQSGSRAPTYRWYGKQNMLRFLEILKMAKDKYNIEFVATKKYDQLVMEKILRFSPTRPLKNELRDSSEEYATKILDLKFALHQPESNNRKDDLDSASNRKPRSEWEQDLNLNSNSSINAATTELLEITNNYNNHKKLLEQKIAQNNLGLDEYFITGILEGDGSLGYSINQSSFPSRKDKSKCPLNLDITFSASGDVYSDTLIKMIMVYFDETQVTVSKNENSCFIKTNLVSKRLNIVKNIIEHYDKYPLKRKIQQARYDLLKRLYTDGYFSLVRNNNLLTENGISSYVNDIYNISTDRKLTLEQVLKSVKNYYN